MRESELSTLLETYLTDETVSIENSSLLLFESIAWGSAKSHALLIEKGARNHANVDGLTTLHCVAERGHAAVVTALLDAGADVDARDHMSRTALHFAAQQGHVAVVKKLIAAGADVCLKDRSNYTVLYYAVISANDATVTALLDAGAAVDARSYMDRTALHFAAHYGHADVVTALLEKGADVRAVNNDGQTVLNTKILREHTHIRRLLRKAIFQKPPSELFFPKALHRVSGFWEMHETLGDIKKFCASYKNHLVSRESDTFNCFGIFGPSAMQLEIKKIDNIMDLLELSSHPPQRDGGQII